MRYQPKRLYVDQTNATFRVAENLSDLAMIGKERIVGVYELVESGTLRCEPTLSLKTFVPLTSSDPNPGIAGLE